RWAGLAAIVLGAGWSIVCVGVIIPYYSGGAISPFTARYAEIGGSPVGALRTLVTNPAAYVAVLSRPEVTSYLLTLLLAGGWLGLLAPELLVVAAPVLALNVFSNSPWMAAGRAHYSASLLPLLIAAAIVGAGRLVALVRWPVTTRLPLSRENSPLPLPPSHPSGESTGLPTCGPMGRWGDRGPAYLRSLDPHGPAERERGNMAPSQGTSACLAISLAAVLLAVIGYHQDGIGPLVAGLPAPAVSA